MILDAPEAAFSIINMLLILQAILDYDLCDFIYWVTNVAFFKLSISNEANV